MGKLRRIHVDKIIERREYESTQLLPDFSHDTLGGFVPLKTNQVFLKFTDEYGGSYYGFFDYGKEPAKGETLDLEYAGPIAKILHMDNIEEQDWQRYVYRKK
jgi:hypothetical protein